MKTKRRSIKRLIHIQKVVDFPGLKEIVFFQAVKVSKKSLVVIVSGYK